MEQTSLFAYNSIQNKLGENQKKVYAVIKVFGVLCDQEIAIALGWSINRVTPRRGELVKKGIVIKQGTKQYNNRLVNIWRAI